MARGERHAPDPSPQCLRGGVRHGRQIVGGPPWIDTDRFDIQGTMAPGTSNDDMRAMVRTLLAARFQLRTHTERRELPVYALMIARTDGRLGPQMRALAMDCDAVRAARARGEKPPSDAAPVCTNRDEHQANRDYRVGQQRDDDGGVDRQFVTRVGASGPGPHRP